MRLALRVSIIARTRRLGAIPLRRPLGPGLKACSQGQLATTHLTRSADRQRGLEHRPDQPGYELQFWDALAERS
jgi:hypothetical protein